VVLNLAENETFHGMAFSRSTIIMRKFWRLVDSLKHRFALTLLAVATRFLEA
jgi:hypothetical protein